MENNFYGSQFDVDRAKAKEMENELQRESERQLIWGILGDDYKIYRDSRNPFSRWFWIGWWRKIKCLF